MQLNLNGRAIRSGLFASCFVSLLTISACSGGDEPPNSGGSNEAESGDASGSGNGSSGGSGNGSAAGTDPNAATIGQAIPEASPQRAARLLNQASFGPTMADIATVQRLGLDGWIDDQLTRAPTAHLTWVQEQGNSSFRKPRHEIWWKEALEGEDQLGQRVAFALSQIFVVSDIGYTLGNSQYGIVNYYDNLRRNAFGNYRQLLEDVTLSPVMGLYLSMLQNARADAASNTRPDENFAREVMQLFSIGLHVLNPDGTVKLADGKPIPTYSQQDVENYARVFTGWNYKDADRWNLTPRGGNNLLEPMEPYPGYHDTDAKVLLGPVTTPAGGDALQDLVIALDGLANHPNVGPFIGKRLIQHLVTSNPTPHYVERITAVFNDNGQGVRGDLKAVIRAILLDPEALYGHETISYFGKLREPLLRRAHVWRAFNARPGVNNERGEYTSIAPYAENLADVFGQAPLRAASVFNFFSPNYAPLGPIYNQGLVAPEAEIYTDNNILSTTRHINALIIRFYLSTPNPENNLRLTHLDLTEENALAAQPGALLDRLNLLLLAGSMSDQMRTILLEHLQALPDTDEGRSQRARDAISLIMASPDYLVQQ